MGREWNTGMMPHRVAAAGEAADTMILEWHEGAHVVIVYRYEMRLAEPIMVRLSPQEVAMLARIAEEARHE